MAAVVLMTKTKRGKKVTVGARVKPQARDKYACYGESLVIASVAVQMWKVRFDSGQEEIFSSKSLSVVDNCEPNPRVAPTPMPPAILQSETEQEPITKFATVEDSENLQNPWHFREASEHDDPDVASDLDVVCAMQTALMPASTTISTICNNSTLVTGSHAPQLQLSFSSDIDKETGDDDLEEEDVNDVCCHERKEKANQEKAELIAESSQ
jgi:hypothetical protein